MRARTIALVIVLVNWGLMTHGTFAGSGDEPPYLIIAHSLAFDADLDVANNYATARLITSGTLESGNHAIPRDGRLLPVHNIGMPLLFAPVLRFLYPAASGLGRILPPAVLRATKLNGMLILRHAVGLCMSLVAAWLAIELRAAFMAIGVASPSAWALLLVLSPPLLSHSFLFFTEILSAAIAFATLRRLTFQGAVTVKTMLALGVGSGFLLLVHIRNVGVVAGLCLVVLLETKRRRIAARQLAAFAVGAGAMVIARTLVVHDLWGTFVTTPLAEIGSSVTAGETAHEIFVRATGLLFDREYGLLVCAPIYLLSAAGLVALRRTHPGAFANASIVAATYLIPVLSPALNTQGWTGGWSPAARFLVPITPMLALGVAAYARRGVRALLWPLVGAQLFLDAYVWQFPKTLWSDGDGIGTLFLSPLFPSWAQEPAVLWFTLWTAGAIVLSCWAVWGDARILHSSRA
jgi:hypothetical protein